MIRLLYEECTGRCVPCGRSTPATPFLSLGANNATTQISKIALALFMERAVTPVVAESLPRSALTSTINHLPQATLGGAAVTAIPTVSTAHYRTILPNTRPIACLTVRNDQRCVVVW